jgi:hypothetical protein
MPYYQNRPPETEGDSVFTFSVPGGCQTLVREDIGDGIMVHPPPSKTGYLNRMHPTYSANMVRTHIKSLYRKLTAHSQYEALARARELKLI